MESVLGKLRIQFRDVAGFGPRVLQRAFQKPDASGYIVVNTRFGRFNIRPFDTDMEVLRQVFISSEYDLDRFPQGKLIRSAYASILRRDKVPLIIDAGANAGFTARFFAQAYPEARILSVEPDPANAALCRSNTRAVSQIDVIEAAVGSKPGHVELDCTQGRSWGTRTRRAESGPPVITVGELKSRVRGGELFIVKVDVEGFELDLFSDATEWIAETCCIIVEPHDWMLPGEGSSRTLQAVMLGEDRDILISGSNLIWVTRGL